MNRYIAGVLLASLAFAAHAEGNSCDKLKEKIVAKLEGKGVKNYTLDIVPASEERPGRVVGQCEGGAKKIVYQRGEKR